MKITPLEIRQQNFERVFRGYDKDTVDAFLVSLSQEWEKLLDEQRHLSDRLDRTEGEYARLKAVEHTLYKTLETAQKTTNELTANAEEESRRQREIANAEAATLLENTQREANQLLTDAQNKARYVVEAAGEELRGIERDYRAIERYRDYLVVQIKSFANDALDKVQRFDEKANQQAFEAQNQELKELTEKLQPAKPETPPKEPMPRPKFRAKKSAQTEEQEVSLETPEAQIPEVPKEEGSFFENI